MRLLTQNPISMDLLYITSSSPPSGDNDDEEDDQSLRPSLLFINVPHLRLSTNALEFHAMTDVVREVLMQSMRSSEIVTEELAKLRYKIQMNGEEVSSAELEEYMRKLNSIIRQFLYAGDTFQHHLVDNLMLPGETFTGSLQRYKAKAKAVATFLRKDQRAITAKVLYPTMYISYSFDECSWELRESRKDQKDVEDAFASIALGHLVCRHIFFVGRASSAEISFENIYAQNEMQYSYFKRILQPSRQTRPGEGEQYNACGIKASDGKTVAFRWFSTQQDRVGGITVFDVLTIQVAPMTAAVTRKLYSSVSDFVFSTRKGNGAESVTPEVSETRRTKVFSRTGSRHTDATSEQLSKNGSTDVKRNGGGIAQSGLDEVSQMAKRGETNMLFKYIYIDAVELTASYKNKDSENRSALDVFDLFVRTPSFSYSSKVWTWKEFSTQIRKDLVTTFFVRGAKNLAEIKLLPGYRGTRRRLAQGADTVSHTFDANGRDDITTDGGVNTGWEEDENAEQNLTITDMDVEEDQRGAIDAAMVDIKSQVNAEDRERVLTMLYGRSACSTTTNRPSSSKLKVNPDNGS